MLAGLRYTIGVALGLAAAGSAAAQEQPVRRWTDPPPDLGSAGPQATAPAQEPTVPVAPPPAAANPAAGEPAAPSPAVRSARPGQPLGPDATQSPARPAPEAPPPVRSAQPHRPAPDPTETSSASPTERGRDGAPATHLTAHEEAARDLLNDYLDLWSAPNPLTLAGSSEFYAPHVIFHGRSMDVGRLLDEKRRFVRRWPERRYRARPETVEVSCGPRGETCTIRSAFDFLAVDPDRGRRSQGIATLELVVRFGDDDRPVIVAENSLVQGRGPTADLHAETDDVP